VIGKLIRSILITLGISALVSLASQVAGYSFWWTFLVVTVVQFGIWNLVQYILEWRTSVNMRAMEAKMLIELNRQTLEIPCIHCKTVNTVAMRFDQDNEFQCTDCDKTNSMYIDIEVAARTEIIDKPHFTLR
tara:strand:- start:6261 stop:6656 length:396 start_codon:yes stop_codon:yes gene_type:complete